MKFSSNAQYALYCKFNSRKKYRTTTKMLSCSIHKPVHDFHKIHLGPTVIYELLIMVKKKKKKHPVFYMHYNI